VFLADAREFSEFFYSRSGVDGVVCLGMHGAKTNLPPGAGCDLQHRQASLQRTVRAALDERYLDATLVGDVSVHQKKRALLIDIGR